MKLLSRFNVSRDKDGPRRFSFEISMSGVISVGIVVVLGMCWVFILGILVGRGYRPESAVPQIAQMMPTTDATTDNTTPAAAPTVLKPEELQFMENGSGKDGEVVTDSTQKGTEDGKKSSAPKGHDLPDARASVPMGSAAAMPAIPATAKPAQGVSTAAAKAVPQTSHERAGAAKTPAPPASTKKADEARAAHVDPKSPFEKTGRYTATYQVASFPAREQADTLAKKLANKGIAASVHEAKANKTMVFRVNIQLKGTEADIADSLKKAGEKGPILLGKKPL